MRFDAPQHVYSQCIGTFLDAGLHDVDGVAHRRAKVARPRVRWIHGLQEP